MLRQILIGAVGSLLLAGAWGCSAKSDEAAPSTSDEGVTYDDSSNPGDDSVAADDVTSDATGGGVAPSTSTAAGLYENGVDGSPILALIQSATTSLDIEIYEMTDSAVQSAVLNAAQNGIAVRIVYEPHLVGSKCGAFTTSTSDCTAEQNYISQLQSAGAQVAPFNKQMCGYDTKCVEHGKLVVVDGATAMVSTGNFAATSLCDAKDKPSTCNVDYSYVLTDTDAVAALDQIIANDLAQTTYDVGSIASPVSSRITVSPVTSDDLVNMINGAQSSITIENQYLKFSKMNDALTAAAQRGVQVTVMVASICAFGKPSNSDKNYLQNDIGGLANAGATALALTEKEKVGGKPGYLHAKTMVVDGTQAWVGSVNGSQAAFEDNREFGVYLTDPGEVQKLATAQQTHFAGAEPWSTNLNCTNKNN
jgi:phosphatidylserine/phosphatidylglycerophosphate/cardiolipin synthase-like enzyme